MNTKNLAGVLTTLFSELVDGAPADGAYILNPGDAGLLRSLDRLSAEAASVSRDGGATIASHAAHLRYGISLLNRWAIGEDPWAAADWGIAWRTGAVTDEQWRVIRDELRVETRRWLQTLPEPREVSALELNGMVGSIAHLAYHLGAIRQIDRTIRGPREGER